MVRKGERGRVERQTDRQSGRLTCGCMDEYGKTGENRGSKRSRERYDRQTHRQVD